jgi:hypothetical protein
MVLESTFFLLKNHVILGMYKVCTCQVSCGKNDMGISKNRMPINVSISFSKMPMGS